MIDWYTVKLWLLCIAMAILTAIGLFAIAAAAVLFLAHKL